MPLLWSSGPGSEHHDDQHRERGQREPADGSGAHRSPPRDVGGRGSGVQASRNAEVGVGRPKDGHRPRGQYGCSEAETERLWRVVERVELGASAGGQIRPDHVEEPGWHVERRQAAAGSTRALRRRSRLRTNALVSPAPDRPARGGWSFGQRYVQRLSRLRPRRAGQAQQAPRHRRPAGRGVRTPCW